MTPKPLVLAVLHALAIQRGKQSGYIWIHPREGLVVTQMGRPSNYTPAIATAICSRLAGGEPLTKICRDEAMPDVSTVYRWLASNGPFRDLYARAREDQADTLADELVRIADEEPDPQKARVMVDARKWVASKLKPKKYGDRVTNEHTGADGSPLSVSVNFVGKPA